MAKLIYASNMSLDGGRNPALPTDTRADLEVALVFNLGGGAGGPLLGRILQRASWSGVFTTLAAAMMLAVAPLALSTSQRGVQPAVDTT